MRTVGIPCSHLMCVMRQYGAMENMLDMTHLRWIETDERNVNCCVLPESVFVEAPSNASTPLRRFNHDNAPSRSLASMAVRSDQMYRRVLETLNQLIKDLTSPDLNSASHGMTADARVVCAGRPRERRIRPGTERVSAPATPGLCAICSGDHHSKRCPRLEDAKRFAENDCEHEGGKKVCSYSGLKWHNIRLPPAIRRLRGREELAAGTDCSHAPPAMN
jgi:hypothetical protein